MASHKITVFPRTIAVWGNSGSGTSTLAIKLALEIAELGKNVVLVDTNYNAPQANVWYPRLELAKTESMSVLLDNNIDVEAAASKIKVINRNLGILGYAKDYASNAIPGRSDTAIDLLNVLPQICDVAIIDCQSGIMGDVLSLEALGQAELRIVGITPDVRGLAWYDSNVRMMEEEWINNKLATVKLFNQVKTNSPANEVENVIGTVQYYLPYSAEIEDEVCTGEMGTREYKRKAKKYAKIIDTMVSQMAKQIDIK